jgi:large subunit ribosomal protein L25
MSKVELKLDAALRKEQGTGASRRLRRAKQIPAILYGGDDEPMSLAVGEEQVLRLMNEESFFSQILEVKVKGKKTEQALLKDLQRHPYKPLITHMDLQRVKSGEVLSTSVPIHFLNEETAKGVKQGGGVIHHDLIEIAIECLPQHIPEYIEVDVQELDVDQVVHLSEIPAPEGVNFSGLDEEHDPAVVSIHLPRGAKEKDTGEDELSEGGDEEGEG